MNVTAKHPLTPAMARAWAPLAAALAAAVVLAVLPGAAAAGDAVTHSCPCSGPPIGGVWRGHGQYVSCITKEAREQARASDLTAREAHQAIRDGTRSSCGRNAPLEGNVRVCADKPVLPCPTVRTAHVDDCTECDAALAGKLVRCARVATAAGGTSDLCGTAATGRIAARRALDVRTGVDCASCTAKLGTPMGTGLDCLVAACGGMGF